MGGGDKVARRVPTGTGTINNSVQCQWDGLSSNTRDADTVHYDARHWKFDNNLLPYINNSNSTYLPSSNSDVKNHVSCDNNKVDQKIHMSLCFVNVHGCMTEKYLLYGMYVSSMI
jgi:hypothetical protein